MKAPLVPVPKMAPSVQPPEAYARDRRAPTVYTHSLAISTSPRGRGRSTHIVHKRNTLDVQMFSVKCILKQPHDVITDRIRSGETCIGVSAGMCQGSS